MAWDQVDTWFWCVIRVVQTHQAGAFGPRQDYEALRISAKEGSRALQAFNCWISVRVIVGQLRSEGVHESPTCKGISRVICVP